VRGVIGSVSMQGSKIDWNCKVRAGSNSNMRCGLVRQFLNVVGSVLAQSMAWSVVISYNAVESVRLFVF